MFSVTLPLTVREGTVTAKLDVIGHMSEPEHAVPEEAASVAEVQNHAPAHLAAMASAPSALEPSAWRAPHANFPAPQPIPDDRANRTRPDRVILAIEDDLRFRAHPARPRA